MNRVHKTDLLIGFSNLTEKGKYFFFADFDEISEEELMRRVGSILFDEHEFGNCYLVKSGRGWHLVNFTEKMNLEEYVKILEEMGVEENYIRWIRKVEYAILRIARRSSHKKVPVLMRVLISPHKKKEDVFYRDFYFTLLGLEKAYKDIIRVAVRDS